MEEFEIKRYASLPCELVTFEIDGEKADKDWFGYFDEEYCSDNDRDSYNCCGKYFACYSEDKVRANLPEKFQYLTDHDIEEICNSLESTLSIGDCGWCL